MWYIRVKTETGYSEIYVKASHIIEAINKVKSVIPEFVIEEAIVQDEIEFIKTSDSNWELGTVYELAEMKDGNVTNRQWGVFESTQELLDKVPVNTTYITKIGCNFYLIY